MLKIVIDTNVFVSSFFGGKPRQVIDLWMQGKVLLCVSQPIIEEYVRVLHRLGLKNEEERKEFLNLFADKSRNVLYVHQPSSLSMVSRDPDDDKFLECAVALEATYLVSGDQDLLEIKSCFGVQILKPAEFLETFPGVA